MKNISKNIIILLLVILLVGGLIFYFFQRSQPSSFAITEQGNMKLISPVFENNQLIPPKYTCDGEDLNPALEISEVPEKAKGLVLIVDDPDAPGSNFTHWMVWNIDPLVSLIEEGSLPKGGIEGLNDFGKNSYGGPCPPSGVHHYHFKLYALDTTLNLNSSSKKADVEKAMEGHILDKAELVGLYQR